MNSFKYYTELAEQMEKADEKRDLAFEEYDRMYHSQWELPHELKALQWIRKVVSTDPHDAVYAGMRVLSSLAPKVKFTPLRSDPDTKRHANEVEKNLLWQLKAANRRRPHKVEADVTFSALQYSATAINVIDLDHHIKLVKASGGMSKQLQAMRKVSRFVVNTYNPKSVHVRRNSFGVEAVILDQDRPAREVATEWGMESKIKAFIGDEYTEKECMVDYYDYTDHEVRCVWIEYNEKELELVRDEHNLPFLPWVANLSGSTLESEIEDQYHPLLYSVLKSGQWKTLNIIQTLVASEAIAHSASPRFVEQGPNSEQSDINYGDPTRTAKVAPGNSLTPIPPQQIDNGLAEIGDRILASISKSTVSQILLGGALPSGTAFGTLNLATQTAMGSLKPAKDLAERSLAEMFVLMLEWVKYTATPLYAMGMGKTDVGMQYELTPDLLPDTENIYLEVELTPDMPTEKMQQANAASMMIQWGYPVESALEDLGVTDPQAAIEQWYLEKYIAHKFDMLKQTDMAMLQMSIQQQQAQQQQQAAGEMQQAQDAQAQQAQFAQAAAQQGEQQPGMFPGGQGFNPAAGGISPTMVAPGVGREQMAGMDSMGSAMQGGPGL